MPMRRGSFLIHHGFEIPVKTEIKYWNRFLKLIHNLLENIGYSTLKYFKALIGLKRTFLIV